MKITSIASFKPINSVLKTKNQNEIKINNINKLNYVYPKNYYLNFISFTGSSIKAGTLADKIEKNNPPSPEIVKILRNLGESRDYSLYDIHLDYYKDLLKCKTLKEAKELYPEFKDVIDAKDIDINSIDKKSILYKIFNGQKEEIDVNDLSIELLKRYYGLLFGTSKKENYWGLSITAIRNILKILNIKTIHKSYATVAATHSKEYRERKSKQWQDENSAYNSYEYRSKLSDKMFQRWKNPEKKEVHIKRMHLYWQNPQAKKEHSEKMTTLHKDPNSSFNSQEYREKLLKVAEAKILAYKNYPEIRNMMHCVAKDFPRLGKILKKQKQGIEITEEEIAYKNSYLKRCEEVMPGYQKIIGEEQHKILVEWGIIKE